jgi:hypothetical protein
VTTTIAASAAAGRPSAVAKSPASSAPLAREMRTIGMAHHPIGLAARLPHIRAA